MADVPAVDVERAATLAGAGATPGPADIGTALERLHAAYAREPCMIAPALRTEQDVKQLFQLLHNAHALPGWFVDGPRVVTSEQVVVADEAGLPVVRGESMTVALRFRYFLGALTGLSIEERGVGSSKDAAARSAYVKMLLRLARDANGAAELTLERLDAALAKCVETATGTALVHGDFKGGERLLVARESATVDFKSHAEVGEVVRQVVGFLNGRSGFGLLVCGVRDATWEVCGVRDVRDKVSRINLEQLINALDRLFNDCNPPLQHGREYALREITDIGIADGETRGSVLFVEACRPAPVQLLYKGPKNECFVRRGPQTQSLTGRDVHAAERGGGERAWHAYWGP